MAISNALPLEIARSASRSWLEYTYNPPAYSISAKSDNSRLTAFIWLFNH